MNHTCKFYAYKKNIYPFTQSVPQYIHGEGETAHLA